MILNSAFAALAITAFAAAVPLDLEERGVDACHSGLYSEIVPILQPYPVAQSFCSKAYPPSCTTPSKNKRALPAPTPAPITPKSDAKAKDAAWSKCLQQGKGIISTVCSCIQSHKPCSTTTSSTTTTTTPTTTTTSTTTTTTTTTTTSTTTTTTTTSTTTTTTTTTTTASPTPTCGAVGPLTLMAYSNPNVADGTPAVVQGASGDSQYVDFTSDGTPNIFTINAACQLVIQVNGQLANTDADTGPVFFNTQDQISGRNYRPCSCTITGSNNVLNCACGPSTYFYLDTAGDLYISTSSTAPSGLNSVVVRATLQ